MKYKIGDRVKINKQATIKNFTKHFWNGCQTSTLEFLRDYGDKNNIFKVVYVENNCLDIKDIENDILLKTVNVNIFKKVEVKEMTIAEIEKELGYQIKIIKEEE